jgi:hypothetical protein
MPRRISVIALIAGGILLGCVITLAIPVIKQEVLTRRYGDELSAVIVNYWLGLEQADAAQDPDLLRMVATGEHLEYLESVIIRTFPSSREDITTAAEVEWIRVYSYSDNRAVVSARGHFWHHIVFSDTGEKSNETKSPFGHWFTLQKEGGVWKVERRRAHEPPF